MAHSVAQVQLAPTGLKSISSSHYLKREKRRKESVFVCVWERERERKREREGRGRKRRKARTEEVKQVLYCLQPQTPPLHTIERKRWSWRGKKSQKKRRFMLPAWNLTKLLLWICWKFEMLWVLCYYLPVSVRMKLYAPEPSSENVPLQQPLCKIGVKYSQ